MAFETLQLTAIVRTQSGKGPSHRLRKAGLVPAVVYSGGSEATSVAIEPKDASKILLGPLRRNVVFTLQLQDEHGQSAGKKVVMIRDVQVDKVRRHLIHADMMAIDENAPVTVPVPFFFTGKSKSVVAGGMLEQVVRTIKVSCMPNKIPEKLELDVTDLPFGTTHATSIVLPEGATLAEAANLAVATIRQPRAEKEEAAPGAAAPGTPAIVGAAPAAPAA